jgi:hypothetical protein
MDEFSENAFANRDDPLPIISKNLAESASEDEGEVELGGQEGKRRGLRKHLSKSNIKDKIRKATGKTSETGISMQDRLLEKCALSLPC